MHIPDTWPEARALSAELDSRVAAAAEALRAWDHLKSPIGLTPDHVKASPEWQAAKLAYDRAFAALRTFNGVYTRRFARELRAERDAVRLAKLWAGQ
jgi:hypothetical protein